MVVSPRCLEQRLIPPTPSHHQCEGRPPALQASRATRASNSAVASAACLEGRPGPVTPSTISVGAFDDEPHRHCERSEAIHGAAGRKLDCFASLAMTKRAAKARRTAELPT